VSLGLRASHLFST